MGNKSPVTLQCIAAAKIVNTNILQFPIEEHTLPWMLREQIWDLISLRNHLAHKFSVDSLYEELEDEIYNSIENLRINQIRFQLRTSQLRKKVPANFDNPPPKYLFNIHHKKYFENKILTNLYRLRNKINSRGDRAVQKMMPLLINLPPQYINISLDWCKQVMEDDEDTEDRQVNLILSLLRDNDLMR